MEELIKGTTSISKWYSKAAAKKNFDEDSRIAA
jgi:hypothetical protein